MDFAPVSDRVDEYTEDMVELQAELTRRPALGPENGGEGEWEKARFLEDYLQKVGLPEPEHYDSPDERVPEGTRPNLAVHIPGQKDGPRIWIMTHMDVVPPGERNEDGTWKGWDSDPFELRRDGDKLFGRGVEDDQQPLVSSVFAARALADLDLQPVHPVTLLIVSEEETGSSRGLGYLLDEHEDLFSRDDIIIVPDGGNDEGSMIEIAEKSVLWLHFHMQGKQSHGSMPDHGLNAFRAASRLVCRLDEKLHERFPEKDSLYQPSRSTFEPTLHASNVPNVNTVPGEDHFCFDCRVLPCYGLEEVLESVRSECSAVDDEFGTETEVSMQNRLDAPEPTPRDAPVVDVLKKALGEVRGVEGTPMGIGGSTVAALFRAKGYHAAVWATINMTAHQANEYCLISNMVDDAKVFAHVFMQDF